MTKAAEKHIKDLLTLHERGLLGHAYIFFGPPHASALDAATALATDLESGKDIDERVLSDAQVFGPDEKNVIGIDAARSIQTFLSKKPFLSSRRAAIVDRAETLTPEAQNALLKIAEEPPESTLLILILTDPELLWATLRSRFQQIFFPGSPEKDMQAWFKARYGDKAEESSALAQLFFKTPPSGRKDFVKALTEPEDFSFSAFLDSLIVYLAAGSGAIGGMAAENGKLWHAVLELRRMQDSTNLSPRIQLMNLWTLI